MSTIEFQVPKQARFGLIFITLQFLRFQMNMRNFLNRLFSVFLALACIGVVADAQETRLTNADDVAFLTEGVSVLPQSGIPGPVIALNSNAFPVVVGQYEKDVNQAVIMAASVQKGRVVAFGHPGYCQVQTISSSSDATTFFNNVIYWCSNNQKKNAKTAASIRVAVWKDAQTANFLKQQGFNAVSVDSIPQKFDVLIADAVALSDSDYDALFKNVYNGAGFITSGLGWGWSQLSPGKSLVTDHAGNKNFKKFNVPIQWTHGTLDATAKQGYKVDSSQGSDVYSTFINPYEVIEFLQKLDLEKPSVLIETLNLNQRRQLSSTLTLSYRYLGKTQQSVCDAIVAKLSETVVPTIQAPVKVEDVLNRLVIAIQTERYIHEQSIGELDSNTVPALAAGNDFPGPVPSDAKRLNAVKVPVKTAVPAWASTGLYAAPGEVVTVRVSPELFAKFPKQFKVRIGVHTDTIWHFNDWVRYPEISLEKPIISPETKIANPFGGLVYIDVPQDIAATGLGVVDFEISGAVSAPYFIKDVTSLDNWKTIRNNPAPWAELQGEDIIVTVPSETIRQLDDPQALMETWDQIIRLEAELASGPFYRERPERITCDREISAGYMHNGYPVMAHLDVERVMVDDQRLRSQGDWGFFHEFGHNHQSRYWTFEGSGEVTVNYFTLYIMNKLCGLDPGQARRDLTKENRMKLLTKYFANGSDFEEWKKEPFLALNMTVQLLQDFGWEPMIRTISEYKKAPQEELPNTDQQKRDQWMIRLSHNTGKNLGPFFEKWGVPTTQEARDSIKDLPIWLPEEFDEIQ